MADAPRFSVTIPAFNAEATLAETVGSVHAQSFGDWEIVICNDGSTDGTLSLAERLAADDPRIRVVSQENRGSGGAYNTAVRNARSDLIVMLSADDLLLPEHLEEFDVFIDVHQEASIFSCDGYYEYEDGARETAAPHLKWKDPAVCTLEDLLSACFFDMGTIYRRSVFDAVGGFREDLYAEDYPFFLLAFAKGHRHAYLNRPLAVHRRNRLQKSADHVRTRQADLAAVRAVVGSGFLSPAEMARGKRVIRHLKLNIRVRKVLGALLGPDRSTKVIDRLLRRGSGGRVRR